MSMTPERLSELRERWSRTQDCQEEWRIAEELFDAVEALQADLAEERRKTFDANVALAKAERQLAETLDSESEWQETAECHRKERDDLRAHLARLAEDANRASSELVDVKHRLADVVDAIEDGMRECICDGGDCTTCDALRTGLAAAKGGAT